MASYNFLNTFMGLIYGQPKVGFVDTPKAFKHAVTGKKYMQTFIPLLFNCFKTIIWQMPALCLPAPVHNNCKPYKYAV